MQEARIFVDYLYWTICLVWRDLDMPSNALHSSSDLGKTKGQQVLKAVYVAVKLEKRKIPGDSRQSNN